MRVLFASKPPLSKKKGGVARRAGGIPTGFPGNLNTPAAA